MKRQRRKSPPKDYTLFELSIQQSYIPNPVKEYRFCEGRKWAIDYAFPSHKLALEIEGGVWSGGRHVRGRGFLNDMKKYNQLAIDRWHLLRVTPEQVEKGEALMLLEEWFGRDGNLSLMK